MVLLSYGLAQEAIVPRENRVDSLLHEGATGEAHAGGALAIGADDSASIAHEADGRLRRLSELQSDGGDHGVVCDQAFGAAPLADHGDQKTGVFSEAMAMGAGLPHSAPGSKLASCATAGS